MNVMVPLPDDFAARFGSGAERERRVLETLAADEYRAGRMGRAELGEVLGLDAPGAIERFLRARGLKGVGTPATAAGGLQDREAAAAELVERSKALRAGTSLGGLSIKDLIAEGRR